MADIYNPVTICGKGPDGTSVAVAVDASGNLSGGGGGGGGGGGAVAIANGADVAIGNTADAAVVSDAAGTVSAKLRGLVKILAAAVDLTLGFLRVSAAPRTTTGRETITLAAAGTSSLTVPGGSISCQIQADGGTLRIRQDGTAPTATVGTRLDDGVLYIVDSSLANVRLYAVSACNVQVVYFDRV